MIRESGRRGQQLNRLPLLLVHEFWHQYLEIAALVNCVETLFVGNQPRHGFLLSILVDLSALAARSEQIVCMYSDRHV